MLSIPQLLNSVLPENRIKSRLIDVVAYAADAGFYHLQPIAVVQPVSELEIVNLFKFSHQYQIPLTFRTGGTSLSGQSITDGILVDLSQHWNKIWIEESGTHVRVQPGIIGATVNHHLHKYGKKIGPDPSSISAAMMGGILSNNSSGMCCGVHHNSYHTTKHIKFILPNGKTYSTEFEADYDRFYEECPEIFNQLQALKTKIEADDELKSLIRNKYKTKNTVGYAVNAFIDYEKPLDILAHLLIGAEGTLGFISEAVLNTVDDYKEKASALLYFPDIYEACKAIPSLTLSGAEAVELMDRASLRSIEHIIGVPDILKTLPASAAALLIEYQANDIDQLNEKINYFLKVAPELTLLNDAVFSYDANEQAFLWKLRKGMFPSVGAVRASGTTVILEDIAFPVDVLGDGILALQDLFKKHDYENAIIFGHAKDGNIHFVVTQAFNTPDEIKRYDAFLRDVVNLVVKKFNGTLKAEHGTGRNMAPFVVTEWGETIYGIMKTLKEVIDPKALLNPGVIINSDANAHIKNLKDLPSVEEEVDKCMECGYCEPVCPSRNLTLTPRQRIVTRRALLNFKKRGQTEKHQELLGQYQYDGLETCAVDGLCASACPVDINTGDLVKRLRRESHNDFAKKAALTVAKNFAFIQGVAGLAVQTGVGVNNLLGKNTMYQFTKAIKKIVPVFPIWSNQLRPLGKNQIQTIAGENAKVVYMPTCISRMMGGSVTNPEDNIITTMAKISAKVGIEFKFPKNLSALCCGQIFSSKGYHDAYVYSTNKTIEDLWETTNFGQFPIVLDVSSCTQTLLASRKVLSEINIKRFDDLKIIDSITFIADYIVPKAKVLRKKKNIVLHPVCSLKKMGLQNQFYNIAKAFADEVTIPFNAGCCGMAGDRGFLFPELTASATHFEAKEVMASGDFDGHYSSAKTCEMAMSEAVGKNYESIVYLVKECIVD
ncbi:FAD-binding and (Fe-S)-binding domain-containing protein [Pedobacter alpinus]|uniref:D-lactate dehydrogenase (cytochrome) n=1 Tax=Pedobacter alpinus TaxID=1590643 RepID=A0ABW5TUF2_9SPHI